MSWLRNHYCKICDKVTKHRKYLKDNKSFVRKCLDCRTITESAEITAVELPQEALQEEPVQVD